MPLCCICNSKFYHQTHFDPPEPCDCGECWPRFDVETEEDRQRVSELTAKWKRGDEFTEKDTDQ